MQHARINEGPRLANFHHSALITTQYSIPTFHFLEVSRHISASSVSRMLNPSTPCGVMGNAAGDRLIVPGASRPAAVLNRRRHGRISPNSRLSRKPSRNTPSSHLRDREHAITPRIHIGIDVSRSRLDVTMSDSSSLLAIDIDHKGFQKLLKQLRGENFYSSGGIDQSPRPVSSVRPRPLADWGVNTNGGSVKFWRAERTPPVYWSCSA